MKELLLFCNGGIMQTLIENVNIINPNKELLTMVHNLLLCYGKCVLELRKIKDVNIGIGLCGNGSVPKTDSKESILSNSYSLNQGLYGHNVIAILPEILSQIN